MLIDEEVMTLITPLILMFIEEDGLAAESPSNFYVKTHVVTFFFFFVEEGLNSRLTHFFFWMVTVGLPSLWLYAFVDTWKK